MGNSRGNDIRYFSRLFYCSAINFEMAGRRSSRFTANASNHIPYFLHRSLTIELGYIGSSTIWLAQFDCAWDLGPVSPDY